MHLNYSGWSADDWHKYLSNNGNVFVMTPAKFHDMLIHGHLHMNHIGLIIFDECHHVAGRDDYRYLALKSNIVCPHFEYPCTKLKILFVVFT